MTSTLEFLRRIHEADRTVAERVGDALPSIARAVDAIAARIDGGGRWLSIGAGTSGRLAVLDAAELPPTFGTDPNLVVAILAGGPDALLRAVEGAEDDEEAAVRDLTKAGLTPQDAVLGITASGTTPYVVRGLAHARGLGALTVSLVCTPGTLLAEAAEIPVVVDIGPEILSGSTRMKAGTAQKMVLNMMSTAVMRRRGLVFKGEMVAVRPTNRKLKHRAVKIAAELLGKSAQEAEKLLRANAWELPVALVAGRWGLSPEAARARLHALSGNVSRALEEAP